MGRGYSHGRVPRSVPGGLQNLRPALKSHCYLFGLLIAVLSHGSSLLALVALVRVAWGSAASLQEHSE